MYQRAASLRQRVTTGATTAATAAAAAAAIRVPSRYAMPRHAMPRPAGQRQLLGGQRTKATPREATPAPTVRYFTVLKGVPYGERRHAPHMETYANT